MTKVWPSEHYYIQYASMRPRCHQPCLVHFLYFIFIVLVSLLLSYLLQHHALHHHAQTHLAFGHCTSYRWASQQHEMLCPVSKIQRCYELIKNKFRKNEMKKIVPAFYTYAILLQSTYSRYIISLDKIFDTIDLLTIDYSSSFVIMRYRFLTIILASDGSSSSRFFGQITSLRSDRCHVDSFKM